MISCPQGLGTVRTGVRPLMSLGRWETNARCGCKEHTGPGAAMWPPPSRDDTPASSLTAAYDQRAGFLPPRLVTPSQELTVYDRSTTRFTRGIAAALVLSACSGGSDSA